MTLGAERRKKNPITYMELMNDVLTVRKLYKTGQADWQNLAKIIQSTESNYAIKTSWCYSNWYISLKKKAEIFLDSQQIIDSTCFGQILFPFYFMLCECFFSATNLVVVQFSWSLITPIYFLGLWKKKASSENNVRGCRRDIMFMRLPKEQDSQGQSYVANVML